MALHFLKIINLSSFSLIVSSLAFNGELKRGQDVRANNGMFFFYPTHFNFIFTIYSIHSFHFLYISLYSHHHRNFLISCSNIHFLIIHTPLTIYTRLHTLNIYPHLHLNCNYPMKQKYTIHPHMQIYHII
jgi:hypothetical protein